MNSANLEKRSEEGEAEDEENEEEEQEGRRNEGRKEEDSAEVSHKTTHRGSGIKGGRLPVLGAAQYWQTSFFRKIFLHIIFGFLLHTSCGLSGALWKAFEITIDLTTSNFTPDAATLTLHVFSWLKRPKI